MDLKNYLLEEDMTGAQFARRIGISCSLVGILCKKERDMTLSIALKIEKYTKGKVKVEDLIPQDLWLNEDGKIKT